MGVNVIVAFVLAMSLSLAVWVSLQYRHRLQMQSLLDRISELESRDVTFPGDFMPRHEEDPHGSEPSEVNEGEYSADVLHGKTSHIRRVVDASSSQVISLADQSIAYVHRNLRENLTPQRMAEELFVSLRTLERGLTSGLDCTPRELILAMKMREARRLLESGNYRVSEVASDLAFSSPSHFSRRFKSFYRVAPSKVLPRA